MANARISIRIWISYDLGIRGDYEGLYKWLDEHKAVETGNSCASFVMNFSSNDDDVVKKELLESLNEVDTRNARIYVIRKSMFDGKVGTRGGFLIGGRKSNPWEGYAGRTSEDENEL